MLEYTRFWPSAKSFAPADGSKLRGFVVLTLRGPDGKIKETRTANTVTTAGKNAAASGLLAAPDLGKPTHMAVGTGSPGANALGIETGRNALATKTRSTNVLTMTATWAPGDATAALTEAGVFDAAAAGNMFLSASFLVINKAAGDTLDASWTWTFG